MPKRETKQTFIKILCTRSQKERILSQANQSTARSVSEYALTLILGSNLQEYGSIRRKTEGALVNAETYQKLGELVDALKQNPVIATERMTDLVEMIHDVRLEIATRRLAHAVEKMMDEN